MKTFIDPLTKISRLITQTNYQYITDLNPDLKQCEFLNEAFYLKCSCCDTKIEIEEIMNFEFEESKNHKCHGCAKAETIPKKTYYEFTNSSSHLKKILVTEGLKIYWLQANGGKENCIFSFNDIEIYLQAGILKEIEKSKAILIFNESATIGEEPKQYFGEFTGAAFTGAKEYLQEYFQSLENREKIMKKMEESAQRENSAFTMITKSRQEPKAIEEIKDITKLKEIERVINENWGAK